ncbi:MAG: DegV family protein [Negativicutes bacterium]|nr:DegV family protein [Negativicutes bacterium]
MGKLHIVLDSTANAGKEIIDAYPELHIVPLKVMLGNREWLEPEISCTDLFRLVAAEGGHLRTSQPAPGEFAAVFEPLMREGHEIIVITISGELSGTAGSAGAAARMVGAEKIFIVDSGTTAIGMVRLAEAAFRLAGEGLCARDIAARLKDMSEATFTMFVPDTLEYLHKGGRIGGAAALFGAILQIKPILYLTEGKVSVLDKVRTRTRAIQRMIEEIPRRADPAWLGVVHLDAVQPAEELAALLRERYPNTPVSVSTGGSVLGAHLGPGLVGVIFQDKRK